MPTRYKYTEKDRRSIGTTGKQVTLGLVTSSIDDYSNLGWFASDRYQPEDKVCVYVFVPNEEKVVHDYDNTDPEKLQKVATLRSITATQEDEIKLAEGRENLSNIQLGKKETKKKSDFQFIVDDNLVYSSLNDFKSSEAKKKFQVMLQVKKDNQSIIKELKVLRNYYLNSDDSKKTSLEPEIIDKEKRSKELYEQIESMETEIRNTELKARGKK